MKVNHNLQKRINQLPFDLRNSLMRAIRESGVATIPTINATLQGTREPNLSVLRELKTVTGFSFEDLLNPDFPFLGNLHALHASQQ